MRRYRSGFTLVELLVVITIIGMLAALIFPAITGARETARRAQCLNNQRSLAQGLQAYENSKQRFPGYVNLLFNTWQATWIGAVLPQLDNRPIYDSLYPSTGHRGQVALNLPLTVCPSTGNPDQVPGLTHYMGNTGQMDNFNRSPPDFRENGVLMVGVQQANAAAGGILKAYPVEQQSISSGDLARWDGVSNTILLSENISFPDATWHGLNARLEPRNINNHDMERVTGLVWWPVADPNNVDPRYRINGMKHGPLQGSTEQQMAFARPSSAHSGGVNVAMADASARFISEEIDYLVYALLMSSRGERARDARTGGPVPAVYTSTPLEMDRLER